MYRNYCQFFSPLGKEPQQLVLGGGGGLRARDLKLFSSIICTRFHVIGVRTSSLCTNKIIHVHRLDFVHELDILYYSHQISICIFTSFEHYVEN